MWDYQQDPEPLSSFPQPCKYLVFNTMEYFIPGSIRLLQLELIKDMQNTENLSKWEDFWRLLSGLCNVRYHEVAKRLKQCYGIFTPGDNEILNMTYTKEAITKYEDQFLEDICKVLLEANFKVVSQEEWNYAISDEFLFTMPFDIMWHKINSDLFPRYITNRDPFSKAIDFSDKVLLFRRGIGTQTITNYFFMEKIDLLIDRIRCDTLRFFQKTLKISVSILEEKESRPSQVKFRDIKTGHFIERRSLRNALPTSTSIVKNFFQKIWIKEPTFKEVVVLYSPKGASLASKFGRVVEMKAFENVPMADLEVTLPNSELYMHVKLRDKIQIVVMLLIGLIMFLLKIMSDSGNWITSITVIFCMGLRIFQVWNGMRNARQRNVDEMTRMLYSKSLASHNALLYYLIHSCEEQDLKETYIGHFFLLKNQEGLTKAALDGICQAFLQHNLGLFVDFDVNSCLKRLLAADLITKIRQPGGAKSIYVAKSLDDSVRILDKVWDNLYSYNNEQRE